MKNKKFVSLLLAIVLCLAMTSSAFASGEGVNRLQRTVAKLREVLPLLVEDLSNDCYLGNMLNVYCINASGTFDPIEYELYPVYSGDAIVALAQVVANEEGKETISCITAYASALQEYCSWHPRARIALVYAHDGVYLMPEGDKHYRLYTAENLGLGEMPSMVTENSIIEYTSVSPTICFSPLVSNSRALQYLTLNITCVPNNPVNCSSCDPIGLCWAASMAMIINYYCNTSHTTSTIHSTTGCMSTGASATDYRTAIRSFGLYSYGPYYSFTYPTIVNLTQGDKLAFVRIERSYIDNGQTKYIGHMIVPYGYYYNPDSSTSKYFLYMDPNYGVGLEEFPTSGTLYVITSGYTYYFDYYLECYW